MIPRLSAGLLRFPQDLLDERMAEARVPSQEVCLPSDWHEAEPEPFGDGPRAHAGIRLPGGDECPHSLKAMWGAAATKETSHR